MTYITPADLRSRLPLDGEGVSDLQLLEAVEAAVEYVAAITGDTVGEGAVARNAAAKLAHADALDIVYPRDARSTNAESVILRQNAESLLSRYLVATKDTDGDISTTDVPDGYVSTLEY